jgi:exodeoxyribonuclease V alpha subunit
MIQDGIPKRFNLNLVQDIQLLCPIQRGDAGDKIMQTENNYDKETYNGDIGIIRSINEQDQEITINFYNRDIIYDYADLDQITLAYATTIHKSQESEYPAVIILLTMQSYMMIKRNIIYTVITRGKKLVVIIGQKKALAIAVKIILVHIDILNYANG